MGETIGYIVLLIFILFVISTFIRAFFFKPEAVEYEELKDTEVDVNKVAEHLTGAIKCKTISYDNPDDMDWNEFSKFRKYLDETYPLIHKNLSKEIVSHASLIYRWKGKNPKLEPMALIAHQDVVPVTPGTEQNWVHDPFEGYNDGEFIWGRGSLDMKNHLICVMESVEALLREGFTPERDVYLCFGHNEEIVCSPDSGAQVIVDTLEERGIHLDSVIDEGGALLTANIKGIVNSYICGVGMAEKGYADFKITVTDKGGHSSQSPKHNGLGKLANVVKDLENNQFKAHILPFITEMFETIGRHSSYLGRLVLCNYKLLMPLITFVFTKIPATACFVRTTTGVSMCEGSPSPNVLPQRASVTANFRQIPGETVEDVEKHIRKVVRYKDAEIELIKSKEATQFTQTSSKAYKALIKVSNQMNPGKVMVVPYLVMGSTDSCHYQSICDDILCFSPFKLPIPLLQLTHGTNERCPLGILSDGVVFFKNYIKDVSREKRE